MWYLLPRWLRRWWNWHSRTDLQGLNHDEKSHGKASKLIEEWEARWQTK